MKKLKLGNVTLLKVNTKRSFKKTYYPKLYYISSLVKRIKLGEKVIRTYEKYICLAEKSKKMSLIATNSTSAVSDGPYTGTFKNLEMDVQLCFFGTPVNIRDYAGGEVYNKEYDAQKSVWQWSINGTNKNINKITLGDFVEGEKPKINKFKCRYSTLKNHSKKFTNQIVLIFFTSKRT